MHLKRINHSCKRAHRRQIYAGRQSVGEVRNQQIGSENSSQYTGRENDNNGLYFYRARYYDPVLKRFISEDPIGLAGGWNMHAYVNGAPTMFADPDGLRPRPGRGGGNSRQRRAEERAENNRQQEYYQRQAEREAWLKGFTNINDRWENYGDGLGALTGGGNAGRHPSVKNALEDLIDPQRRRRGEDWVPLIDPPENCRRYK